MGETQLDVRVLSPWKIIFEGKAKSVILPGESGVFEVLAFHKPILSRLLTGILYVDESKIPIRRGIVKCYLNEVVVIVEEMGEEFS